MGDCGCPMGPHDPGCYCGCRPACESFVNSALLPFLGSGCGQCLIKYVTGPLWRGCDMINGNDCKDPERPSGLNAIKALVVLTFRPVKDIEDYKKAFGSYAKFVQASNPGIRAFFSFIDKGYALVRRVGPRSSHPGWSIFSTRCRQSDPS